VPEQVGAPLALGGNRSGGGDVHLGALAIEPRPGGVPRVIQAARILKGRGKDRGMDIGTEAGYRALGNPHCLLGQRRDELLRAVLDREVANQLPNMAELDVRITLAVGTLRQGWNVRSRQRTQ
jgi:hypothetical protein